MNYQCCHAIIIAGGKISEKIGDGVKVGSYRKNATAITEVAGVGLIDEIPNKY